MRAVEVDSSGVVELGFLQRNALLEQNNGLHGSPICQIESVKARDRVHYRDLLRVAEFVEHIWHLMA